MLAPRLLVKPLLSPSLVWRKYLISVVMSSSAIAMRWRLHHDAASCRNPCDGGRWLFSWGSPWTLVSMRGATPSLGPLFAPNDTAGRTHIYRLVQLQSAFCRRYLSLLSFAWNGCPPAPMRGAEDVSTAPLNDAAEDEGGCTCMAELSSAPSTPSLDAWSTRWRRADALLLGGEDALLEDICSDKARPLHPRGWSLLRSAAIRSCGGSPFTTTPLTPGESCGRLV